MQLPAGTLSTIAYTYLICSVRVVFVPPPGGKFRYDCIIGQFDEALSNYKFRIGSLNFSVDKYSDIRNRYDKNATATIKEYSNEVYMD